MTDPKTPSSVTKAALAAAWATSQIGTQAWNEWCQQFAENAYGESGKYGSAGVAGNTLVDPKKALKDAKVGDLIYFVADDTNNGFGHVGIYVGNGQMVSATPSGVKRTGILTDSYYAARFRGVGEAPSEWAGKNPTDDLIAGAEKIMAQVAGGNGMADTNPHIDALTEEQKRLQTRIDLYRKAIAADKARMLIAAYEGAPDVPTDKWLKDNNVTPQQLEAAKTAVASLSGVPANLTVKDLQEQIDKDERSLADTNEKIGRAKTDLAKGPTSSTPEPKGTQTTRLETLGDGKRYNVPYVADGLGNWAVDTSRTPTLYGPQKDEKSEPRFFTRENGQVIITDADGSNGRELLPADKMPGYLTDPATGDMYLQKPNGMPGAKVFSGKPNVSTVTPGPGRIVGINPTTGDTIYEKDFRSQAEKDADALKQQVDAAANQWKVDREALVSRLSDARSRGEITTADMTKQLDEFVALHDDRAREWQAEQQRLAAQQAETKRANEARERQADEALKYQEKSDTAKLAEQERSRLAQGAQAIAKLQADREQGFSQSMAQFEQSGVATGGRIAGLNAQRRAPSAQEYAAMLGLPANDPRAAAITQAFGALSSQPGNQPASTSSPSPQAPQAPQAVPLSTPAPQPAPAPTQPVAPVSSSSAAAPEPPAPQTIAFSPPVPGSEDDENPLTRRVNPWRFAFSPPLAQAAVA